MKSSEEKGIQIGPSKLIEIRDCFLLLKNFCYAGPSQRF